MKTLYLDCFSGISGDMMLGALLDINDGEKELREGLSLLGLDDQFELIIEKTQKSGVTGTKVTVRLMDEAETHGEEHGHSHEHAHDHDGHTHEHAHSHEQHTHAHEGHAHEHGHSHDAPHVHKGLTDIANLINGSALSAEVKETAIKIFTHLAEAEAHVHGTTPDDVHFHEVGAVDAIVDIVGTSILFHRLAPDTTICGPVNLGSGFVKCAHGLFPVPAPAVAQILRGLPVFMGPGKGELTTPTGSAILYTLCDSAEPLPKMEVGRVGYGLGQRDMETLNALRAFTGILKNA